MTADVEEMERMISGYLAFARGEGEEQAEPADLSAILEEVAAAARRSGAKIDAARHAGSRAAAARGCGAAGDHEPGGQCPAPRGAYCLGASVPGAQIVQVTVDDDGPGIPPEQRESVFRPFESGAHPGGTGLGLTIARDIVRAHGGDIVLSDSPLGGLRATIRLPV